MASPSRRGGKLSSFSSPDESVKNGEKWPWFPSEECTHISKSFVKRTYILQFSQRLFLLLESPLSSKLSMLWSLFVLLIILFSCAIFIMSTVPSMLHQPKSCSQSQTNYLGEQICEPVTPKWFDDVELFCIIIFTFDYLLRLLLVSSMPPRLLGLIKESEDIVDNIAVNKMQDSNDILSYMQLLLDEIAAHEEKLKDEYRKSNKLNQPRKSISIKLSESYINLNNLRNQDRIKKSMSTSNVNIHTTADIELSSFMPRSREKGFNKSFGRSMNSLTSLADLGNEIDDAAAPSFSRSSSSSNSPKGIQGLDGAGMQYYESVGLDIDSLHIDNAQSHETPPKKNEHSQSANNLSNNIGQTSRNVIGSDSNLPSGLSGPVLESEEMEFMDIDYSKTYKLTFYFLSLYNIIDLLAIIPFYIQLSGSGTNLSFIRVLRLARVMRVFKLGKNMSGFVAVTKTIKHSIQALGVVGFFILLSVLLFGAIMYFIESGVYMVTEEFPDGAYLRKGITGNMEISPYTSIPASLYWAVVTAVTVGYGDIVPSSAAGKIVAVMCMYLGVLMMALPITVIGNNFNREYEKLVGNDAQQNVYETLLSLLKKIDEEVRHMARRNTAKVDEPQDYSEKTCLLLKLVNSLDEIKRNTLHVRIEKFIMSKQLDLNNTLLKRSKASKYETKYCKSLEQELEELDRSIDYISLSKPFEKNSTSKKTEVNLEKRQFSPARNTYSSISNTPAQIPLTSPAFVRNNLNLNVPSLATKLNAVSSPSNSSEAGKSMDVSKKSTTKWDLPE